MTPRRRRLVLVLGIVAGASVAGALALSAFRQNVTFYFLPSEVAAGKVAVGQSIRLGGMVTRGSFVRVPGSLESHFVVTDSHHEVPVTYDKVLPDLFREARAWWRTAACVPTAPSSPTRCSPSTTRNTCRPRSRRL